MRVFLVVFMSLFVSGCLGLPKGVYPVDEFDLNRYLGKWYEIARLDHSFERGLDRVTAEYSLRDDGGVRVINRGFSIAENRWKEAEGKAYFVRGQDEGYLKVSFFGPFYGSYVVFELDKEKYKYAFVAGSNTSYLWLLSKTPTVSKELVDRFIKRSKDLGYDTDNLIFVEHNYPNKAHSRPLKASVKLGILCPTDRSLVLCTLELAQCREQLGQGILEFPEPLGWQRLAKNILRDVLFGVNNYCIQE